MNNKYKIIRPAVSSIFIRPVQNLVFICGPNEGTASLDPFLSPQEDASMVDEEIEETVPASSDDQIEEETSNEMEMRDEPMEENPGGLEQNPEPRNINRRQRKQVVRYGYE